MQGLIPVNGCLSARYKSSKLFEKNQVLNHELEEFSSPNYLEEEIDEPTVDNIEGKFELDLDGLTEKLSQEVSEGIYGE